MNTVALSEWVATLESGSRPKGGIKDGLGDVPSLGAEHLSEDGGFNFAKVKRIPLPFYKTLKRGRIAPNDILIVKDGATTGKVSFVNGEFPFRDAAINEHVFLMRIDAERADPRFVFRFLQSPKGQMEIMKDFRGATVGGIGRTFADKVSLPDINRHEQCRIATILDKADGVRRKRKQALKLSDHFLRSVFDQLFGNLQNNPKGWNTDLLGNILSLDPQNGLYRPSKDYGSGTYILRIDSFYDGYLISNKPLKQLRLDQNAIAKYLLCSGDIVINRVNSREYLGKSTLIEGLTEHTVFESNMMRLRVREHIADPRFLVDQLQTQFIKRQILRASKDAVNQSSINQSDVKNLEVRLPPIDLQRKYAEIVAKKNSSDRRLHKAVATANELFEGLAQSAFRGEL